MEKVRSRDGTEIAFDREGTGPPVVLVAGASCDRAVHSELAKYLSVDVTVLNYDRRGRGDSGDTSPFAVEREIEDLAAVVDAAGQDPSVFGNSSGAILALRAAGAGVPMAKLALWEPPFGLDEHAPSRHRAYVDELTGLLSSGLKGDAMALFLRSVGVPEPAIAGMRQAPTWSGVEDIAPTLLYDAAVMGDSTLPEELVSSVSVLTLVLDGSETGKWAAASANALEAVLPNPTRRTLAGQNHAVDWRVLASAITDFLIA
jgi:pimeloyl-ACP methyl ester carboxylesterase